MQDLGLHLELRDQEWEFRGSTHDRAVARAIVVDEAGQFYFMRVERDDIFGNVTVLETAGGGVEAGESLGEAVLREVQEELGAEVEVLCKIGLVSDYYNLIERHNLNHYFLCRVLKFGETNRTQAEIEDFHLATMQLSYEEAVARYRKQEDSVLGRLITQRELPVLEKAMSWLENE